MAMLQTIEVQIDTSGYVHPLEPLPFVLSGRGYLTLLPAPLNKVDTPTADVGSAARALKLLASPRFAQRPTALAGEVQRRIEDIRNDWGDC